MPTTPLPSRADDVRVLAQAHVGASLDQRSQGHGQTLADDDTRAVADSKRRGDEQVLSQIGEDGRGSGGHVMDVDDAGEQDEAGGWPRIRMPFLSENPV